jgi:hypothetical protein
MNALTGLSVAQLRNEGRVTEDAKKEFLIWLAYSISLTESKYKPLAKRRYSGYT